MITYKRFFKRIGFVYLRTFICSSIETELGNKSKQQFLLNTFMAIYRLIKLQQAKLETE